MESYVDFFRRVCAQRTPFPFQLRFHESKADLKTLKVPTGLGKTDTVLLDWLYRRPTTRLVYCLPGRALTRQVVQIARQRVEAAGLTKQVQVLELMGGEKDLSETLYPDQPAILIGTQDILVSRALNRGYARTPFRWPMDFALLNNDVAWVFDEVQLLGEALPTSTQLAAFRSKFGVFGNVPCTWMSATLEEQWLQTVDLSERPELITLDEQDLSHEIVRKRYTAEKSIEAREECGTPEGCAQFVAREHIAGSLSIIIANTVARAQEIYTQLEKLGTPDLYLLHSRYRPLDRAQVIGQVLEQRRGIVVSTQVIEAGVDVNATLMVSDVAPWSSLVQRFGRVNRYGETPGRIVWVDKPTRSKKEAKTEKDLYSPYEPEEVRAAIGILKQLTNASPDSLDGRYKQPAVYDHVLRRRDLLDLFDTTPDLAGNQIDVSRFVRNSEETSAYVAWREWAKEDASTRRRLDPRELCAVRLGAELDTVLKRADEAWEWNYTKQGKWQRIDFKRISPGMQILLRSEAGGYDPKVGWNPQSKKRVDEIVIESGDGEGYDSDPVSAGPAQTLADHTDEVVQELEALLKQPPFDVGAAASDLRLAARHHDWGKAHPVFQSTMHGRALDSELESLEILAKSVNGKGRHNRSWFRHELASALAMIESGHSYLAAYLTAAHHGKVRLNIRSMPGEKVQDQRDYGKRIARGVIDGEVLYKADLGGGLMVEKTQVDLSLTEMGVEGERRAWSDRLLDLLDEYGPFKLAMLETLLRAADERASKKAQKVSQ